MALRTRDGYTRHRMTTRETRWGYRLRTAWRVLRGREVLVDQQYQGDGRFSIRLAKG